MAGFDGPCEWIEPFIERLGEPRAFWLRKPRPVGERILVGGRRGFVPGTAGDRVVILLHPKTAFGTGGHGTTEGCLVALEKTIRGGESVLDVGTGTGILAIAARKLGAGRVTAIDIDRKACREARENLALNGIGEGIDLVCGGVDSVKGAFDIVVANLRTGALVALAEDLFRRMNRQGIAIFSGILERESHSILRFFESRPQTIQETIWFHGWMTLVLAAVRRS
ncbi:MAG TPA: 50S ribosomal protein L11 methyltransferase [Candidatus Deferrimicrobiaceae bacterium]|nr:50S ribosomal protein L11 methyltransferase [Candidatus Deferrimicrobiaceae bacterium]